MTLRYDIDADKAHARITGEGQLTMPAMIDAVDRVADDPGFRSEFSVILDLREADYRGELRDGDAFVTALKRRMDDFQNNFALLVPEELHFLAKLYSVLARAGGFDRMQCFTDVGEACRWCGLPDCE